MLYSLNRLCGHTPRVCCALPVLLVHTTCATDDAACAIFTRFEPLLDPFVSGAHYSYRRWCSLCTLHKPRAFTRPVCSWRALLVPPLVQLVHSSHASSLYSTRVLLARTTRTAVDVACALFERLGPLLDPGSLAGTNFPADATACAVFKRLGPLLDLASLAGKNCPANATVCVLMTRPTMFHVQQFCNSWLLQALSKMSPQKSLMRAPR